MANYSAAQLDYAKRIEATGKSMGMTPSDIKTAIMVALAESDLQNYANENVPDSYLYPHDNVGADHQSVGVFQQQVGIWGSTSELMDVDKSAAKFFAALKNVPGRDTMTNAQAAQAVQRSAFPDGSNYAKRETEADTLLSDLGGTWGGVGGTFDTGTGNGVADWWTAHGGWKRLGLYALGGIMVWIAGAYMLGTSRSFKDAVRVAERVA